ncbi:MAG TPA: ribonuclease HI family protein [Gemmataceae bacterium]|jgi:ribonuclease HI|nr:ribonuclease HI family protein [Gemmataceae bacterium]
MSLPIAWKIHIDGAARGNPGPAAFAFVIQKEGSPPIEENGLLGVTTNNLAEYTALVRALERAAELGARRLIVHSDSELLVKQMNGAYRVKSPDLRVLHDRAKELIKRFEQVLIRHVRREQNSRADELCNQALDEGGPKRRNEHRGNSASTTRNHVADDIREKAIHHLQQAAQRWSEGDIESHPPEAVWDELWQLLEENGIVLRSDGSD